MQPKLAARVRLLEAGDTNKTGPDDARSVAVAALRSKSGQEVTADGHAVVLKVRAKHHRDLSRTRNQVVCRLHAVLCELIPGGVPDEITAGQAAGIRGQVAPAGAVAQARCELAAELLAGIRHLDAQRREVNKKLAAAVTASGTSLTEVSGAGPVIAATVIGDVITVARFPGRDHLAARNGTAPAGVSSGASGRFTGCRCAATGVSTMPSIWPRSTGSGTSTATAAPATSASSLRVFWRHRSPGMTVPSRITCGNPSALARSSARRRSGASSASTAMTSSR